MRAVLPCLLSLPFLAACAIPSLDVQGRYSPMNISGSAGFASGAVGGSADLEEAGLDDDNVPSLRMDLKFGAPHLVALAQAPSFSGSGQVDATLTDGTNTILVGADVDSQVDLGQYTLGLLFDLFPGDTIELALGFGVTYLDLDARFRESGGATVSSTQSVPVPMLMGAGSVWIGPVELAALAGAMQLDYDGDSASYLDADVYARWKLFGGRELLRTSLLLGYRYTNLEVDYEDGSSDVDVDFAIEGAYIGLEVSL